MVKIRFSHSIKYYKIVIFDEINWNLLLINFSCDIFNYVKNRIKGKGDVNDMKKIGVYVIIIIIVIVGAIF